MTNQRVSSSLPTGAKQNAAVMQPNPLFSAAVSGGGASEASAAGQQDWEVVELRCDVADHTSIKFYLLHSCAHLDQEGFASFAFNSLSEFL